MAVQAKFKQGQSVTINGKADKITAVTKDFAKQKITYIMKSGLKVMQGDKEVKMVLVTEQPQTDAPKVAAPKANKGKDKAVASQEPTTEEKREAIFSLDRVGMMAIVAEQGLDIDGDDYDEDEELANAICDELGLITE